MSCRRASEPCPPMRLSLLMLPRCHAALCCARYAIRYMLPRYMRHDATLRQFIICWRIYDAAIAAALLAAFRAAAIDYATGYSAALRRRCRCFRCHAAEAIFFCFFARHAVHASAPPMMLMFMLPLLICYALTPARCCAIIIYECCCHAMPMSAPCCCLPLPLF